MSNLTFSGWTQNFENAFTTQQFQSFQTLIQTSPLLVSLLNSFQLSPPNGGSEKAGRRSSRLCR